MEEELRKEIMELGLELDGLLAKETRTCNVCFAAMFMLIAHKLDNDPKYQTLTNDLIKTAQYFTLEEYHRRVRESN